MIQLFRKALNICHKPKFKEAAVDRGLRILFSTVGDMEKRGFTATSTVGALGDFSVVTYVNGDGEHFWEDVRGKKFLVRLISPNGKNILMSGCVYEDGKNPRISIMQGVDAVWRDSGRDQVTLPFDVFNIKRPFIAGRGIFQRCITLGSRDAPNLVLVNHLNTIALTYGSPKKPKLNTPVKAAGMPTP